MNLLVTGAAGFIGSHFVLRHSVAFPDDTIVVLDKLTYAADKSFLDPVIDQIEFVEGDIADQKLVEQLVQDNSIDTIINFAAESHVDNSITDATPFLHTNIVGVQSLIEACKTHPSTSLFHISTDEVYGDIGVDDPPRTVEHPLYPSSPYAASKAAAEMLVMAAKRTFGIRTAVTRCTNNYGPHQADEKFLPTIVRNVLKDEPIPIYGTGKNKRDWLYVTDHCDALEIILANSQAFEDGAFFNISADAERENIEVAKAVLDIMGKPQDMLSFVEDRLGHDWRYALDSSGTHALGWKPSTSFDDGLKKTVEWYTRKYSS